MWLVAVPYYADKGVISEIQLIRATASDTFFLGFFLNGENSDKIVFVARNHETKSLYRQR